MRRLTTLTLCLLCLLGASCGRGSDTLVTEGVSLELAQQRAATIQDLRYRISFSIPQGRTGDVEGSEDVMFSLDKTQDIILDFREDADRIHSIAVSSGESGFKECAWEFGNEHIIIPSRYVGKGENTVRIEFTAGNQSLNRRDGYVYTLFVPDRARTVFPCFDQPDLKARFALTLDVPVDWKTVTNTDILSQEPVIEGDRKKVSYNYSDPIPTYLFAFAAGEFQRYSYTENGRSIGAYYRETDPVRIAQLPEICHQVIFALEWQEDFTGVPYPFQSYNLVILPGFQFGGMEHTGCTFYNDNTIFLPASPTPDEMLRRTELISHETTHMWFGDAVTMRWFNDVWTKEVFANYFAAEITAPLYPELNHELNWLKTYVATAVSQDRTEGRTSIRQDLDNLKNAGLIYNNIIYNKAPVMMRKMVELMGKDAFQRGIRKYVSTYLYGNATWDELIAILDAETPVDLEAFSLDWVDTASWPQLRAQSVDDPRIGKEYGYMELSQGQIDSLITAFPSIPDPTRKQAVLMTLNENWLNHRIDDKAWMEFLSKRLPDEKDPLTASTLISYMDEPLLQLGDSKFDCILMEMAKEHPMAMVRTALMRLLGRRATDGTVVDWIYGIWKDGTSALLSESDNTTLSYELALKMPQEAESIIATQRSRITNPDRLAQFEFISPSLSPSKEVRDSVFNALLKAENRRIEPWAQSALSYLNHPSRESESIRYIRPALDLLPQIQKTGDIFFPGNWCSSLLSGHRSKEALEEVEKYLSDNPDQSKLLRNKVLQAEYYLKRSNK